jgi:hypothetical protein
MSQTTAARARSATAAPAISGALGPSFGAGAGVTPTATRLGDAAVVPAGVGDVIGADVGAGVDGTGVGSGVGGAVGAGVATAVGTGVDGGGGGAVGGGAVGAGVGAASTVTVPFIAAPWIPQM